MRYWTNKKMNNEKRKAKNEDLSAFHFLFVTQ